MFNIMITFIVQSGVGGASTTSQMASFKTMVEADRAVRSLQTKTARTVYTKSPNFINALKI
ncbi:hypothetical protein CkP1_0143 [Citrobacter phage CkP1]|nr:hypothetical protein CkP1_0143 [Citrobacter phage CkP1]